MHYATYSRTLKLVLSVIDAVLAWTRPAQVAAPLPDRTRVRKILVCDQAHLGDAILSSAAVQALIHHYPEAEFGVLVHPGSTAVFDGMQGVSRIHTVEHWHLNRRAEGWPARLKRHVASRREAARELTLVAYDLAIDLRAHFPNSIPLLHQIGVPHIVGWSSAGFGAWLTQAMHDDGMVVSEIERHRRLLRLLDLDDATLAALAPNLRVASAMAARWRQRRLELGVPEAYVAVHVGAHAAHRRWSSSAWGELVAQLQALGWPVVLLGQGAAEERICHDVSAACQGTFNVSGQLVWGELLAAIHGSRLLISHDSAATHLGAALNRPRICIAAGIHDLSVWLQQNDHSVIHMKSVPCSPCGRTAGCETMDCLRGVKSADVVSTAVRLLAASKASTASTVEAPRTSAP